MMDRNLVKNMLENAGLKLKKDKPLSKLTTFRIGGPAEFFVSVRTIDELRLVVNTAKSFHLPWFIIGAGSNLLAPDEGFKGIVFQLSGEFTEIEFRENIAIAGAGVKLQKLCNESARKELSGLEFIVGIPGTVGGGIYMNAGAWHESILDKTIKISLFDTENDEIVTFNAPFDSGYRKSPWQNKRWIILSAEFELKPDSITNIETKMKEFFNKRKKTQPLSQPSAGSVFKNPLEYKAAFLIESAGLKGLSVGGAKISTKHSNFIVNEKGAKCKDVLSLINIVITEVEKKYGVKLEPEIELMEEKIFEK